ncbi:MAG TPA: hypothetical protein VII75_01750 [Thermoanaerobaculia bacterium]|nr:hypothetical protein [Thermoanaerobaculia bacterium]
MKLRFALLALLALAASGQEKPLPKATEAWKWTIEQRIAARLDPGGMAERRHAHIARNGDGPDYNPAVFIIEGEVNPELFMPYELMTFLIVDSDPRYPTGRISYGPIFPQFGWDQETFWNDVRSMGAGYIELQEKNPRPTDDVSRQLCAMRATLLDEMRRKYPRFDEFLYVAVATHGTFSSVDVLQANWLRWVAGGCK